MAQIKKSVSVLNGSQNVTVPGADLTQRIKRHHIFMVEGSLVPYTVAVDSTFDGANTLVTLTGAYQGVTNPTAAGVFAVDATYPDMIPTISQGDVGTAAIFTNAMYRLQEMISAVDPDGLTTYADYYSQVQESHTAVSASEANVVALEGQAATSAAGALASKNAAKTSETNSKTSETNASASKNAAKTSETNSKTSETNALASKNAAATSEGNALASKNAAATSETNAKTSETNAATSAAAALASKNAAGTSETNALASKNAAATSATNAATSETNALASKNAAATSASNASTSASNASGSATAANTAKVASETAKTAAEAAKAAAETAKAAAETAKNQAVTAKGQAETAAGNAANSATAAATSASQTAAHLAAFREVFLGQFATAPTLDPNGNAIREGAQYFNTTDDLIYERIGGVWVRSDDETQVSSQNAALSASNAAGSAGQAAASASNAAESATVASGHAGTATAKAAAAAASESNANTSKNSAATSASTATTKASEASTSASNAATSATNAATSATTATTKAGEAATSASDAATSASNASASATAANTSKVAAQDWATKTAGEVVAGQGYGAKKYANDASASATNAATSASTAGTHAGTATTKAGEASTSASNALASKNAAATSEVNALASKNAAATSASNAATSESSALASKNTATTQANLAKDWATKTAGEVVAGEGYGAKKYATDAAASAAAAAISADQASNGQINSDWSQADPAQKSFIANKPSLAAVATSGSKADVGLGNVENKSAATLKSEIMTNANVVSALNYTPVNRAGDTVTGPMNFNDIVKVGELRYKSAYMQSFVQSYSPASYLTVGEFQELLTVTPVANSNNYHLIGTVYVQGGQSTQIIQFELSLRSNTLPDLAWSATYTEHQNGGASWVKPVLWVKETNPAAFKLALEGLGGTVHNITMKVDVVNRGGSSYLDNVVNTTVTSDTAVMPAGFVSHDFDRISTIDHTTAFFNQNVTAPAFIGRLIGTADAVPFSGITGKPTTLAGYGITDAEGAIAASDDTRYFRGDKTWAVLNKYAVGLDYVENKSGWTIRNEMTKGEVTKALGFEPAVMEVAPSTGVARAVGWYTVAVNGGNRASAKFVMRDKTSGRHQTVHFYASHSYGNGNEITILHNSSYSQGGSIRQMRILSGLGTEGVYAGAMLQVYVDANATDLSVVAFENVQDDGWTLKDFVADGTDPGDLGDFTKMNTVSAWISDLDRATVQVTGDIYAGTDTQQFKVWHEGNDGAGSGLDADMLDGMSPSFAATGNTIAQRNAAGYLDAVHFSATHVPTARTTDTIFYSSVDNYIRKVDGVSFKTSLGLNNVENKSAATIRAEMTAAEVTTALGSTLTTAAAPNTVALRDAAGVLEGTTVKSVNLTMFGDRLENYSQDIDTAAVGINYRGYQGGTTRYRNFIVFDGKQSAVMMLTGSSRSAVFYGDVAINGRLSVSTIAASKLALVDTAASETTFSIDGHGSYDRAIDFKTIGSLRWRIAGADGDGSSDFSIRRYDTVAGGTLLGTPLRISRTSGNVTLENSLTVGGTLTTQNLVVNGTTTTVNSTAVTLDDPILTLGGDTAPTVDDAKDRGIEFRYYNGGAKLGFMGYDRNADNFTFLINATNTGEVYSGTKATLNANLSGTVTGNASTATKLATARAINGVNFDGTANITVADGTKLPLAGGVMTGALSLNCGVTDALHLNNGNIVSVNHLRFADPGPDEGIQWDGGSGWKIVEAPNDLTNAGGNIQFVLNSVRQATVGTDGGMWLKSYLATERVRPNLGSAPVDPNNANSWADGFYTVEGGADTTLAPEAYCAIINLTRDVTRGGQLVIGDNSLYFRRSHSSKSAAYPWVKAWTESNMTGAVSTITTNNFAANMALVSDVNGKVGSHASVTTTELGYLDGVTSAIQTQLNDKQASLGFTPLQQGGAAGTGSNKVYIGWASDGTGLKAKVDSSEMGYIYTSASGKRVPFAEVTGTASVAQGGTGATTAAQAATNLGLGTSNSPSFVAQNLSSNAPWLKFSVQGAASGQKGNMLKSLNGNFYIQALDDSFNPIKDLLRAHKDGEVSIPGTLVTTAVKTAVVDRGSVSGAQTLDLVTTSEFVMTLIGATTFAFTNAPAAGQSQVVYLRLTNAGAFPITWPTGTKFSGKSLGQLTAAGVDLLGVKWDSVTSTYMVFVIGKDIG